MTNSRSAVWLVVLAFLWVCCGTAGAQKAGVSAKSCKSDAECPSGQRCGFTWGCEGRGKCVVEVKDGQCIDPGGRCGCDGKPVELFCAAGLSTEFASRPVGSVGGCPKYCDPVVKNAGCPSNLVCREGVCVQP